MRRRQDAVEMTGEGEDTNGAVANVGDLAVGGAIAGGATVNDTIDDGQLTIAGGDIAAGTSGG